MKDRMKDDAMQREHHELEKASRNHEHDDSDHSNVTSVPRLYKAEALINSQ